MHADRGQNVWELRMLKGDFREAGHHEQGELIPDLNGVNMENVIHLNRFIFLVDETKLEDTNRAYLSCVFVFTWILSKRSIVVKCLVLFLFFIIISHKQILYDYLL